jgi:hypothetical protein
MALAADKRAAKALELPARSRLWLVHAVIVVIVVGSFYDIVTGREHWPFSPYAMYSRIKRKETVTTLRLYGVTEDGPAEMPLSADAYIQPFRRARLAGALSRMNGSREPTRRRRLTAALRDCLERYEALRRARRHDGPALQAIRLYRVHWKLDPWARNEARPDQRDLIFEVRGR